MKDNLFLKFFRWLPHPTYGKCGGASKDCSDKPPLDWMDMAFAKHDNDLYEAKSNADKYMADLKLAYALREGDPKELPFYGKVYRLMAMMVFRAI